MPCDSAYIKKVGGTVHRFIQHQITYAAVNKMAVSQQLSVRIVPIGMADKLCFGPRNSVFSSTCLCAHPYLPPTPLTRSPHCPIFQIENNKNFFLSILKIMGIEA